MKYAFTQVAFGLGANALIARDAPQCVQLKASGGASGILGQYTDGQNRIGGGYPTGCYCLSNGGFTDSNGRGCILTGPTTQWQCDAGATPTTGFAIGSKGGVTYNGNGKFYACPYNDQGGYNVYTQPAPGQAKCVEISLSSAGSCGKGAQPSPGPAPSPAPSQPASPQKPAPQPSMPVSPPPAQNTCPAPVTVTMTVTAPAPPASMPAMQPSMPAAQPNMPAPKPSMPAQQPSGSCPADLNGNYQYPHLIVPVNSGSPNQAYGTSYNGKVDKSTCSIFNFDIPASYSGKQCSVVFLFPQQKDLQTSSYTTSGSGSCSFSQLNGAASQSTSWSNQPSKKSDLGNMSVAPGNSYVIASGACAAGQTVTYSMCSSGDYSLNYFQDYNPSPIGMYVRQC
ncbi:ubiquitin 3 binding protein But2 C-terminal domain-containing protein [Phaeosphaeria sp. MPI-PUGE-AT-0046c]|nr:ubiquitin 3 binding protein But2 C-terminal domain-containing protein [Phaeosphaeria sp. MPI-PUGE-AT-0046c]